MRDQVWVAVHALAENEGITFNDCLSLTLQVLNLLLQIPMDISFQTQIPLTTAYCLESSIYRRWCPKQGRVSPLHKEVRASQTLFKVLGRVTHQPSERVDAPHLQLSLTTLQDWAGCKAPEINHAAMPKLSPHPTACNWALPTPRSLTAAGNQAVSLNSPMRRRTPS